VRPLQSKWQVTQWQKRTKWQKRASGKKPRPLWDVISEFRDKVIKAAQKLRQQLADSAEQPALPGSSTDRADVQNDPAKLRSWQGCTDWVNTLSQKEIAQSKPVQRLQAATALLQRRPSRQQRQEVQQLFVTWGVCQKAQGRKREYEEVKADLVAEIVGEARRLQKLQEASEAPNADASATAAGGRFSAIRASFQQGPSSAAVLHNLHL
jgi:hypothetical protein